MRKIIFVLLLFITTITAWTRAIQGLNQNHSKNFHNWVFQKQKEVRNTDLISSVNTIILGQKPVGIPDVDTTNIDTPIKTNVKKNDGTSGLNAKVTPATNPLHGTIIVNPIDSTITYTPFKDYVGKDSYTYTLTTPDGVISAPITVSLVVKPIGLPDFDTTNINTSIKTIVKKNDGTSGVNAKVTPTTNPLHGIVILNPIDSTITYTPAIGYTGKDSYTYTLTTPDGVVSDPITVSLVVKPVGIPDVDTTNIDTPIKTNVKKNDGTSGLNAKVTPATNPLHGTVTVNPDSTITYTPASGFTGKDSYTYTLKTPDGVVSGPITVSLVVKPVGVPDTDTTNIDTPIKTNVKKNDGTSGVNAKVTPATNPLHGTIRVNPDSTITYTPQAGYTGKDSYKYTLTTPDGLVSPPITVSLTVKPIGVPDNDTTLLNTPINTIVKNNDGTSGINNGVGITTLPNHGKVTLNPDSTITYTPVNGYTGKDSYAYTLITLDGVSSSPIKVSIFIKTLLPVTFTKFTATTNDKATIKLSWQTILEFNTNYFVVQRSKDGVNYVALKTLKAAGNGSNNYQLADYFPFSGINYYRLQSVDKDGSKNFSEIVSINVGENPTITITPNPATDFAKITLSKMTKNATIAIFSLAGKLLSLQSFNGTANFYNINTKMLASGMYVLKVETNFMTFNEKLVVK